MSTVYYTVLFFIICGRYWLRQYASRASAFPRHIGSSIRRRTFYNIIHNNTKSYTTS